MILRYIIIVILLLLSLFFVIWKQILKHREKKSASFSEVLCQGQYIFWFLHYYIKRYFWYANFGDVLEILHRLRKSIFAYYNLIYIDIFSKNIDLQMIRFFILAFSVSNRASRRKTPTSRRWALTSGSSSPAWRRGWVPRALRIASSVCIPSEFLTDRWQITCNVAWRVDTAAVLRFCALVP